MATTKSKAAGPANVGLQVVARAARFRRAGFEFTGAPTVLPMDRLTVEQVDALKGEPMLVVTEVEIKAAA